ncbi:MAG: NAD-dependent epimerase/dehydratase family protein [Patescibacteria group bacterium]
MKQSEKNKILLLGGTGFIGRNILESLGKKYEFLAPSKQELDLRKEAEVFKYLEKNPVDLVINAVSTGGPGQEKEEGSAGRLINSLKTFFSLIKPKNFYKRMIFFGSGAMYDKTRSLKKIKETELGKFIPADEYGLYKYVCSEYAEKTKDIVCLNLFGVYGKYEDYRFKFVSNVIVKNLLKQDIVINQNVVFDYLFIDDLISIADYFIMNKSKFQNYNSVPDKSIDLISIATIVNEVSDYKSKIIVLNKELNNEYTADNSRLKNEIPQLKFTEYKKGIEKLFKYYKENINKHK